MQASNVRGYDVNKIKQFNAEQRTLPCFYIKHEEVQYEIKGFRKYFLKPFLFPEEFSTVLSSG